VQSELRRRGDEYRSLQARAACGQHYMQTLSRVSPARFDVIAIDQAECIEWVRNAFET
jgi:Holliday junction resolvase-like predicted endonuclease